MRLSPEKCARWLLAKLNLDHDPSPETGKGASGLFLTITMAFGTSVIGVCLYLYFGQPLRVYATPTAAEEALTEPDPVAEALVRIEAEAAAAPDNERAWSALAPAYIRLGRYADAVNANRQLLRIKGEDGALRANLGEAEVAAAGGKVTPEARAEFEKALQYSPGSVMAKFYLGLAAEQAGDKKGALEAYEPLIAESLDHPHWVSIIQTRILALTGPNAPNTATPPSTAQPGVQDSH